MSKPCTCPDRGFEFCSCAMKETPEQNAAIELADRYHKLAEEFDRSVCTGPIVDGSIIPATSHELAIINFNAARLLRNLMQEAAMLGVSRQELMRAIRAHKP